MTAYEMIGRQYFYMSDLQRSGYYIDRFQRGKFEIHSSKVRELSLIQYHRKLESRYDKAAIEERKQIGVFEERPQYDKIKSKVQKAITQIYKIQRRSKEGYYKIGKDKDISKLLDQTRKQSTDGQS